MVLLQNVTLQLTQEKQQLMKNLQVSHHLWSRTLFLDVVKGKFCSYAASCNGTQLNNLPTQLTYLQVLQARDAKLFQDYASVLSLRGL
jgi:hypothetical protein